MVRPDYVSSNRRTGQRPVLIPTQQRVRRDESAEGSECRPSDYLGLLCEPATLGVRPAKAIVAKRLTTRLILRLQVRDHGQLVSVEPTSEDEKEALEVEIRLALTRHDYSLTHRIRNSCARSVFCTGRGEAVVAELIGLDEHASRDTPRDELMHPK
jgi:hypothetical protein